MKLIRRVTSSWQGRIGLFFLGLTLAIALLGPFVSPYSASAIPCPPFSGPTAAFPLGCDPYGHDVLSRLLWGGRSVVFLGFTATTIAYIIGASIGLVAGYKKGRIDTAFMRIVDLMLAFPPILLILILATGAGVGVAALLVGIILVQIPGVSRIVRAATIEVSGRGFVEAATARGEQTTWILRKEILPMISTTIVADAGPRLTASILLVAAVNFLGLGLQPPSADWALMISENRAALSIQGLSVIMPAVLIGVLTVGVNLVADAAARATGTKLNVEAVRR
jgi:peptide/nickel transport system permease protein